jgi:hypothetical protein
LEQQKRKIFILVEGVTDIRIMKELIVLINKNIEKPDIKSKELTLDSDKIKIVLKAINGWGYIKTRETLMDIKQKIEEGYTCLVILDADDVSKDPDGGFDKRTSLLNSIKINNDLNFEFFLLPDNMNNGDLEDVLIKSIPEDRKNILACIESYRDCWNNNLLESQKRGRMINKNVIQYYEYYCNKSGNTYNFNSENFNPLKYFLDRHIKIE